MAKRLQVLLHDPDYREMKRIAHSRHMTLAEWVRQALDRARHREPLGDAAKKLDIVRAASKHNFPTADIDQMLAEIESGYRSGPEI
jgi:hypothetical protein